MNFAWNYFFVLAWFAYLIGSGVLLFSRGFLLSRVSKTNISSCRRLSTNPLDEYQLTPELVQEIFKDVNASSNLCLPQKAKVIILVIDALKYEFGVYDENRTEPLPFENKLPVLHELLQEHPDRTHLTRFKADPPTTTLQRLKGLTTGSLPTFIDIGSNFASPEINEDNIIDQMIRNDLPVVFMGDSTWTDLYPRRFKRAYSYPSFDIFDLDTVDNNIRKHLPKELDRKDWEVLIAHFLGVDHCGHKHGPHHEEMARKLGEMDAIIRSTIEKMDNDTILLVMGDHGMTASGDHGGESDDEINALLFGYSKQHKFVGHEFGSDKEMLQQIDIVPTLATILGIPMPYSNLGLVNFNLVPDISLPYLTKHQTLLLHAWQNAQQIYQYFYTYATENKRIFNVEQMDKMETEFILLTHRVKTIYNELAFKSFIGDLNAHLRMILDTCRQIWVKFDAPQMSQGLLVTFLAIFCIFILVNNLKAMEYYKIFSSKNVLYTYLINFAAGVFGYRYYKNFSFKSAEHGIIFFTTILSNFILLFHIIQNWSAIVTNWSNFNRFGNLLTRCILVVLMSVFFSNSFIIQEPKILSYLLVAVLMLLNFELLQNTIRLDFKGKLKFSQLLKSTAFKLTLATIAAIALIRSTHTFFRCREEQGNCADFTNSATNGFSLKQPSSGTTHILAVISIVLCTTLSRLYLRSCGNLTGNAFNVLLARYGPTVGSICIGGHILLANNSIKNIQRSHIDAMALVIYALFLLQSIVFIVSPLMAYVLPPRSSPSVIVNQGDSIVPEIFKKIKRMYDGDEAERRYEIPVVYGLATIYSSIAIAFGTTLALFLAVLLEPKPAIGFMICIAVAVVLLSVHTILRFRTAKNFETCVQPRFTAMVAWFLLAHFSFYATSHQTTLSQIDWRAAFVGRTTSIGHSTFISGVLVIVNTFCGYIFFYSMYGLLSSETYSIFALFPNLLKSNSKPREHNRRQEILEQRLFGGGGGGAAGTGANNSNSQRSLSDISNECVGFDMTRGELILFENETIFLSELFKMATQFFVLQGVKVFCSMLACTIHCRHLMVWKIFAPRFIYEGLATYISFIAIIIGYLLFMRIHVAVDRLIRRINKIK